MSYFGQRLKIYFRCEREQLSNRLIMILESQEPPSSRGSNPERALGAFGGLLRVSEPGGWGITVQHPPAPLPSCRGGRNPTCCGGRRAAVGNWKWQTLARRCREGHYVAPGTKCQERGGRGPVSKGQGPARVQSVFLAGLGPGCAHRGPGRASAQREGRICQVLPDVYGRVPSDVAPAPQSKTSLIRHGRAVPSSCTRVGSRGWGELSVMDAWDARGL